MTDVFAEWVEKAARLYHLADCDRPACLHVPFDEDRARVRRVLDLLRSDIDGLQTERDDLHTAAVEWRAMGARLARDMAVQGTGSSTYADVVEKAATAYHRGWCDIPYCVHSPFPADRALAETMLGPVRAELDSNELAERRERMAHAVVEIGARL